MSSVLRGILSLDRSYFLAAWAFIAAVAGSVYLFVAPVYTEVLEDGSEVTGTLVELEGVRAAGLLIVPIFVSAAPLLSLPRRRTPLLLSHRVNAAAATVMLFVFVGVTLLTLGLVYVPALVMSTASTASLFFRRDRRPGGFDGAGRQKSQSLSKKERRRTAVTGGTPPPPGTSSKRRSK